MCKCTPEIETPFCGKPGCEWPEQPKADNAWDEMSPEEYQGFLRCCYHALGFLSGLPLAEMLNQISRADTLGPILDPTQYHAKMGALEDDKGVLHAAHDAQKAFLAIAKRHPNVTQGRQIDIVSSVIAANQLFQDTQVWMEAVVKRRWGSDDAG